MWSTASMLMVVTISHPGATVWLLDVFLILSGRRWGSVVQRNNTHQVFAAQAVLSGFNSLSVPVILWVLLTIRKTNDITRLPSVKPGKPITNLTDLPWCSPLIWKYNFISGVNYWPIQLKARASFGQSFPPSCSNRKKTLLARQQKCCRSV